jgi:EAL domain-containing protein (putative c-di-GMP-specific phosphodiesterase class I)
VFSDEMLSEVTELWQLQNDLSHALERDELQLHYQPIFSLASREIVSAEALMRWRRGSTSVSPGVFIPVAEDIGLIESLGAWALRQACMQNAEWRRRGLPLIRIAVNVSSKQLQRPGFAEAVGDALADSGLPGEALALELTETALMESLEQTPALLRTLRELGVEVAIDDFGTGYSSLSYLRQFDFQTLKIDRSFVEGLVDDPRTAALARGLIGLAHNLGLKVTAEGVETMAQLEFLRLEGCDQIQGFLASRPVDAESFERLASAGMTLDRALKAVQ